MKSLRRQFTPVQFKKAGESYQTIFHGLHYRHEFARRDPAVVAAGASLAKTLGMPGERFRTFVANGRYLTDEILEVVIKPTNGKKREALGSYLKTFNVVPMTWALGEARRFFERGLFEMPQARFEECRLIFKALMKFEGYALAALGTERPVMFPALLLKVAGTNKEFVARTLDLGDYVSPMFLDFSAPKTVYEAYFDAYAVDSEFHDFRKKSKEMDRFRIRDTNLDSDLEVLDAVAKAIGEKKGDARATDAKSSNAKVEIYELTHGGKGSVKSSDARNRAIEWYDEQVLPAQRYVEIYREFV